MPQPLFEIKVIDVDQLLQEILRSAYRYCQYTKEEQQSYLKRGVVYMSIELWDGRVITATPIASCQGYDLHEIKDFVLMDGQDIKMAIEGSLLCLVEGLKKMFVTESDMRDATDILLWQFRKSS